MKKKLFVISILFLFFSCDFLRAEEIQLSWPAKGQILYRFGEHKADGVNQGIDIQAIHGSPVYAAANGVVIYSNPFVKGYGALIIIEHKHGYQSVYAHQESNSVLEGQTVNKGQVIGRVGRNGRVDSTYLHFELRKNNIAINPVDLMES